jgi:hypothetical protein
VRRIVAALLVGAALGFAAGFFVFDWRFGGPEQGEVEAAVAAFAARGGAEVRSVECEELRAPAQTWDCTIEDVSGSPRIRAFEERIGENRYRALVQGESIRVEKRR